ncbi:MAG: cell wall-active antibiotics response protein [Actinomycetia bacterium]|nr:cell wall-active antibiotics response protein [Actinomycetes bacterium]
MTGYVPPPRPHWAHTRLDEPKPEPKPPGPPVTSITMAVTAVVIGALLVIRNVGSTDLGATVFVGAILAVLGAGLVASSIFGRALPLVLLSLVALVVLTIAPLLDTTVQGGVGTKWVTVTGESGVAQPSYSLGIGELRADFRNLDPTIDHEVEVAVGAGNATIIVARDMQIEVEATNRAGYLDIVDEVDEGVFNEVNHFSDGDGDGDGLEKAGGTLKLIIDVTFGYAEVIRRG